MTAWMLLMALMAGGETWVGTNFEGVLPGRYFTIDFPGGEVCNPGGLLEVKECPATFMLEDAGQSSQCVYGIQFSGELDPSPVFLVLFERPVDFFEVRVSADTLDLRRNPVLRAYDKTDDPGPQLGLLQFFADTGATLIGWDKRVKRHRWQYLIGQVTGRVADFLLVYPDDEREGPEGGRRDDVFVFRVRARVSE